MNRPAVTAIIRISDAFFRSFGHILSPFAYWSPDQMRPLTADDAPMISDHMLG